MEFRGFRFGFGFHPVWGLCSSNELLAAAPGKMRMREISGAQTTSLLRHLLSGSVRRLDVRDLGCDGIGSPLAQVQGLQGLRCSSGNRPMSVWLAAAS